ncbi:MAG: glycerophosphodiester phosphodiesterase family protein [Acidobacteriota bacterium]
MENLRTASTRRPLIIAHRGASATAPENTLAAFSRALREGADGLELDVRLARDCVPVVIHDATLRRTGLCAGIVSEMTSGELSQVSVGKWFNSANPRLARAEYEHEKVPSLQQVFSLVKAHPSVRRPVIYVEIKLENKGVERAALASSVADLIVRQDLQKQVVVVSFELKVLTEIKAIETSIRTGALFEPKRSALQMISGRRLIDASLECGAEEILLHRLMVNRRLVRLAADKGLIPVVWTVDDPKWLSRATRLGIHAIITNNPAGMIVGGTNS